MTRGSIAVLLVLLNTICWFIPVLLAGLVKLLPVSMVRRAANRVLVWAAENWISGNGWIERFFNRGRTRWQVTLPEGFSHEESCFVVANHQSWVDIFVLQRVFNRRIPFLRFFLKRELIWVPLLGIAWWALDFPFMKRHSREYLERHPERRGDDMRTTIRACEKFRHRPVAIMNFLEGTRFREHRHAQQASPYRHLLKPRAGGMAFALQAMNGSIRTLLDVTIVYRPQRIGLWDLFAGRINEITVNVRRVELPAQFLQGDYENDPQWREAFQAWLRELWAAKDAEIERISRS